MQMRSSSIDSPARGRKRSEVDTRGATLSSILEPENPTQAVAVAGEDMVAGSKVFLYYIRTALILRFSVEQEAL